MPRPATVVVSPKATEAISTAPSRTNTKAIQIDPRYASPFNNRGVEKKKKGDLDSAIADYTRAIEIDPGAAGIYNNRGVAKWDKGDLDGSRIDFAKASEIRPPGLWAKHLRNERWTE